MSGADDLLAKLSNLDALFETELASSQQNINAKKKRRFDELLATQEVEASKKLARQDGPPQQFDEEKPQPHQSQKPPSVDRLSAAAAEARFLEQPLPQSEEDGPLPPGPLPVGKLQLPGAQPQLEAARRAAAAIAAAAAGDNTASSSRKQPQLEAARRAAAAMAAAAAGEMPLPQSWEMTLPQSEDGPLPPGPLLPGPLPPGPLPAGASSGMFRTTAAAAAASEYHTSVEHSWEAPHEQSWEAPHEQSSEAPQLELEEEDEPLLLPVLKMPTQMFRPTLAAAASAAIETPLPQSEEGQPKKPSLMERLKMKNAQKWSDAQFKKLPQEEQKKQLAEQQQKKLLEQQQMEQQRHLASMSAAAAPVHVELTEEMKQLQAAGAAALVQQQRNLMEFYEQQQLLELQGQLEQYMMAAVNPEGMAAAGFVPGKGGGKFKGKNQSFMLTDAEREAQETEYRMLRKAQLDPAVVFKIAMCQFFSEGTCRRGDKCTYAHHESELRPPDKTLICKFFMIDQCRHGITCRFAHGAHELKKPQPIEKAGESTQAVEAALAIGDPSLPRDRFGRVIQTSMS